MSGKRTIGIGGDECTTFLLPNMIKLLEEGEIDDDVWWSFLRGIFRDNQWT